MANKPLKTSDQEKQLKPPPPLPYSLICPINGNKVTYNYAYSPLRLRLDIICLYNTDLDARTLSALQGQFKFWLDRQLDRVDSNYMYTLDSILANLWEAHKSNKQLITPLRRKSWSNKNNPKKLGHTLLRRTLTFLHEKGFVIIHKGKPSEFDSLATWCSATPLLVHWFELDGMRTMLNENANFVELRKTKKVKKLLTDSRHIGGGVYESYETRKTVKESYTVPIPSRYKNKAKLYSESVRGYNNLWTNFSVSLDGNYVRPWCHRVFNETMLMGGRFYGGFQTLPKLDRERLLIDGMPTVEPDFSGLHFNLLYARKGIQFDNYNDDVYAVDGYDRRVIKLVMLPLMNTTKLSVLEGNITTSGMPQVKRAYQLYKCECEQHKRLKDQGIANKKPKEKFTGFIEGIPDNTSGSDLLAALKDKHKFIADFFGTENLGITLQNQDSTIMANIISRLTAKHIPMLPVHDSIRCKISDFTIVYDMMLEQYNLSTGFKIRVT
jgi:hypothetical protein